MQSKIFAIFFSLLLLFGCSCVPVQPSTSYIPSTTQTPEPPQNYTYQIINVYPHDSQAYTQGLAYYDGVLYESTGLYGSSSLRKVDLLSGKVLQIYRLPEQYFGEGIASYDDSIIQLTWQSHKGFVYDRATFNLLSDFSYPTEGWGITYDGSRLIMSDGTSTLYFLEPVSFSRTESTSVYDGDVQVPKINELEYIKGKIFANIYQTDRIAIIKPADGKVEGWINLAGLLKTQGFSGKVDVLNGIAYDSKGDRLFVTGKLWPFLFEIKLLPE